MPVHTEPGFFWASVSLPPGMNQSMRSSVSCGSVIDAFIDVFTKFMNCFESQVQYL